MLSEILTQRVALPPLKTLLKRHRITQVEVARTLGISRVYLTQILNGYCSPSDALAKKLDQLEKELLENTGKEVNADVL